MHAPAGYDHGAPEALRGRRPLSLALTLAAGYMLAEVAGGLWTGSLALLADAGHMLSDTAALALALFALWVAERPPDSRRTYGYYRAEILAALAQGAALVAVAVLIAVEAFGRLGRPHEVMGLPMMAIAFGGLLVNLAALRILSGHHEHSLNVRGAWLHVLSDALGSVAAMLAGAAVWLGGWAWADPVASLVISVLVIRASWSLLGEAVSVLLEGAPRHIDVDEVRTALAKVPGVQAVHDLHIWTIASGMVSLSCHVVAKPSIHHGTLLRAANGVLAERFSIDHSTVQIEPEDFEEHETHH